MPDVGVAFAMQGNAVFAEIDQRIAGQLQEDWRFHVWAERPAGRCVVRWMTAFDTTEADVDALAAAVRATLIHVKHAPA
jgi:threonine aldolase